MGLRYSLILMALLVGCASQPSRPLMSLQEIASMKIDCNNRNQVKIIEEELSRRKFYTVEGVVGNEDSSKISKQFYTYSRYKIWSIRTACPQSY
jgi:hypothetical protein